MTYDVELSLRAERDLEGILAFLVERSPQGAAAWLRRWDDVRQILADRPYESTVAPESDDHDQEIRHIVFKTRHGRKYRALFIIRGDSVFITNLRGPGQDLVPPDQLPTN